MQTSRVHSSSLGRAQRSIVHNTASKARWCRPAAPRACRVHVQAMQSGGWNPQQQPPQPMQQVPPQQQQQMGQQPRQPLARSPAPYQQPAGAVFLELTQVLNKQVITRTSGRCLGTISGAWLDPAGGTLVSFDLDERKQAGSGGLGGLSTPPRAGNIPLSALRQIGDVVLVHDESGLYEQDLDGRLGFVNPVGLDVRTRAGEFLGKVRDLSFSPDSGAIRRITYDEFGLPFLPISFFDCYSVAMPDVISIGRGELLVYDDAKYRERKESAGLFAAIPSLFKSLNGPSRSSSAQLALPAPGGTSDMYRLGGAGSTSGSSSSSRFLPTDYTYEQWQADLRRWEAETGMTYEQYLRTQSQQPAAAGPRQALPPAGRSSAAGGYGSAGSAPAGYAGQQQYPPAQQQRQPGYMPQQPQQQQQQPMYPQQPGMPAWQQPQQQPQGMPQQQQQYAARPSPQQYAGGMGQQAPAAGFPGGPQNPVMQGMGPNTYAAPGSRYPGAAGAQQGFAGAMPQQPQQQQRAAAAQPGQQQQAGAMGQQPQQAAGPARTAGSQQQQQPLRSNNVAGAGSAGAARSQPAQQQQPGSSGGSQAGAAQAGQQQQRQQAWQGAAQQQPQQQQKESDAGGRPVNEWMERETRPRIADALADGVLPSSADAPAAPAFNGQQQPQQQEVA